MASILNNRGFIPSSFFFRKCHRASACLWTPNKKTHTHAHKTTWKLKLNIPHYRLQFANRVKELHKIQKQTQLERDSLLHTQQIAWGSEQTDEEKTKHWKLLSARREEKLAEQSDFPFHTTGAETVTSLLHKLTLWQ